MITMGESLLRVMQGRFVQICAVCITAACLPGCSTPPRATDSTVQQQHMLALLMPSRIEIVEPFTRVKSFQGGQTPDGIELLLQAVNALGDPGLMIVGRVRAELYEYIPGSGDPKGNQLEQWKVELTTPQHQRTYWSSLTQMYELRLGLDPVRIPPADKYILWVTYDSPLGDRLTDEIIIDYRGEGSAPLGMNPSGSPLR